MEIIKVIFFDLDDTLYPYWECHAKALHESYTYWNEITGDSFEEFEKKYSKARERVKRFLSDTAASHSRALYFQTMVETEFKKSLAFHAAELTSRYWDTFIKVIKPYPYVKEFLKNRAEEGIKLGIITNMSAEIQLRKLHALQIDGFFEIMVTSEEVGKEKPHPHIFLHALNRLKVPPQKTIMVGDSYNADIEPASFLEMRPILFDPRQSHKGPKCTKVSSFEELEKLFKSTRFTPLDAVIKFNLHHAKKPIEFPVQIVEPLCHARNLLWEWKLIGTYPENHPLTPNIGYGNISVRYTSDNQFVITGSQTGDVHSIRPDQLSLVTDFDINSNTLIAKGPAKPSSESLTHAAIYEISPNTTCVIHVHNEQMWKNHEALGMYTTPEKVEYGTPEMARSIQDVFMQAKGKSVPVAMLGHQDGLITWGKTIQEAMETIHSVYKQFFDQIKA